MRALDLLAVGEIMLDVVGPPLAVRAGGSPVTAALAVAALGGRAAVVGRIGDDSAGLAVSEELRRVGVDPLLAVDPESPTGLFISLGEPPSILVNRGANTRLASDGPACANPGGGDARFRLHVVARRHARSGAGGARARRRSLDCRWVPRLGTSARARRIVGSSSS